MEEERREGKWKAGGESERPSSTVSPARVGLSARPSPGTAAASGILDRCAGG